MNDFGKWIVIMIMLLSGFNAVEGQLKLLKSPTNVSIKTGQSAILFCEFNEPVNCVWYRHGIVLSIVNKNRYIDGNNGKQTNCSIEITKVTKTDSAKWACSFTITDDTEDPLCSDPAFVTVISDIPEEESTGAATVSNRFIATRKSDENMLTVTKDSPVESSGATDKIMWISIAIGLVALSIINTVIVLCYRRRAKSRRSSKNNSPMTSRHGMPQTIIINRPNSVRHSQMPNYQYPHEILKLGDNEYLEPILSDGDITILKTGKKENYKEDGHSYQNLRKTEYPIYEEIHE